MAPKSRHSAVRKQGGQPSGPWVLVLGMLAMLGLWRCEWPGGEAPPPFHHKGQVIVLDQPYTYDTSLVRLLDNGARDTLWKVIDSTLLLSPTGLPGKDTLLFHVEVKRFKLRETVIRTEVKQGGRTCDADSGVDAKQIPPVLSNCVGFDSVISSKVKSTWVDTLWIDSQHIEIRLPTAGGPVLGVLPLGDTLKAVLNYPDSVIPGIAIYNPTQEEVALRPGVWLGASRFSAKYDSLKLIWPAGSSQNAMPVLGVLQGELTAVGLTSRLQASRLFRFTRRWVGFVPQGGADDKTWEIILGKATSLTLSLDANNLGLRVDPTQKDSLVGLRSRFSLVGDFKAEVNVSLPTSATSNAFIAWYFAGASEAPVMGFYKGDRIQPPGFDALTFGAGFYLNTTGRLNPPLSLVHMGSIDNLKWEGSFPTLTKVRAERLGNSLALQLCDASASKCSPLYTLVSEDNATELPGALRMHFIVGGFGATSTEISWQNLTLTEGRIEP